MHVHGWPFPNTEATKTTPQDCIERAVLIIFHLCYISFNTIIALFKDLQKITIVTLGTVHNCQYFLYANGIQEGGWVIRENLFSKQH